MFLLDTNICSFLIRKHPQVLKHFLGKKPAELSVSVITAAELYRGAEKKKSDKLKKTVRTFLTLINVLEFNVQDAYAYGTFRTSLNQVGKSLSNFDMLIASHAYSRKCTLVTNDKALKALVHSHLPSIVDWTH